MRLILVMALAGAMAAPAAAAGNTTRTSAGARPAATYTAAAGSGSRPATRQAQPAQRPAQVRPAYNASPPRSAGQASSSSTRYQFTEVPPRSLW